MEGDAALLRRMLDNLIRNSIVHNPQGCHISVMIGAEEERCTCMVTDNGVGIDAARLEALNREADVSSTQGGEHGLGLKLVRQIVKAHGGSGMLYHRDWRYPYPFLKMQVANTFKLSSALVQ